MVGRRRIFKNQEEAAEANRVRARNNYRLQHNIPIDAPKRARSKPLKAITEGEITAKDDERRTKARNAYRLKHGIPIDAPKWTHAKTLIAMSDKPSERQQWRLENEGRIKDEAKRVYQQQRKAILEEAENRLWEADHPDDGQK